MSIADDIFWGIQRIGSGWLASLPLTNPIRAFFERAWAAEAAGVDEFHRNSAERVRVQRERIDTLLAWGDAISERQRYKGPLQ